jgi:hypothetical protein
MICTSGASRFVDFGFLAVVDQRAGKLVEQRAFEVKALVLQYRFDFFQRPPAEKIPGSTDDRGQSARYTRFVIRVQ